MKKLENMNIDEVAEYLVSIAKQTKFKVDKLVLKKREEEIICPVCKGIFSRDKNHTCTCHQLKQEVKK